MSTFEEIVEAAKRGDRAFLEKWKTEGVCTRKQSHPKTKGMNLFLTPVSFLALEDEHAAVDLLLSFRPDKAYINNLAEIYAFIGIDAKVDEYRLLHNANVNVIARGYAAAGNDTKVEEYRTKHHADVNKIAWAFVKAGNDTKVEKYRLQHNANVNSIAKSYAIAGNDAKVEEYRTQHKANVDQIAGGYAFVRNDAKVEEYRLKHNANVHSIAMGYAAAGNDAKVEEYLTKHHADVNKIARAFVKGGNDAKVEEYRLKYNADVSGIAIGYERAGNSAKALFYRNLLNTPQPIQPSFSSTTPGELPTANHSKQNNQQTAATSELSAPIQSGNINIMGLPNSSHKRTRDDESSTADTSQNKFSKVDNITFEEIYQAATQGNRALLEYEIQRKDTELFKEVMKLNTQLQQSENEKKKLEEIIALQRIALEKMTSPQTLPAAVSSTSTNSTSIQASALRKAFTAKRTRDPNADTDEPSEYKSSKNI